VSFYPLALDDRFLIPVQAKPAQTVENILRELWLGALFVRVLNSQQKFAVLMTGKQPIKNSRTSRSDVKRASGAWGQTNANRH
jgi:hypothetical protein